MDAESADVWEGTVSRVVIVAICILCDIVMHALVLRVLATCNFFFVLLDWI